MNKQHRTTDEKELSRLTKEEWREYTKTVWQIANVVHDSHPAVFPPEIPRRLIKMFTFVGETVLDPFAGAGTTAHVALELKRRAIAVDQNPAYVDLIEKEAAPHLNGRRKLVTKVADSRSLDWIRPKSVGLVVTSPPYWNKANYGRKKSNLGNIAGYLEFIESLRPAFEECHRVLMPGRKVCVVTANVNQHTDQGLLSFPLAIDIAMLLRDIGFVMVNEIIWTKDGTGGKWGSWGRQRPIFGSYPYPPNFLFKTVHEYILVFARPRETLTRGPKVVPLDQLMKLPHNGVEARSDRRSGKSRTID